MYFDRKKGKKREKQGPVYRVHAQLKILKNSVLGSGVAFHRNSLPCLRCTVCWAGDGAAPPPHGPLGGAQAVGAVQQIPRVHQKLRVLLCNGLIFSAQINNKFVNSNGNGQWLLVGSALLITCYSVHSAKQAYRSVTNCNIRSICHYRYCLTFNHTFLMGS